MKSCWDMEEDYDCCYPAILLAAVFVLSGLQQQAVGRQQAPTARRKLSKKKRDHHDDEGCATRCGERQQQQGPFMLF